MVLKMKSFRFFYLVLSLLLSFMRWQVKHRELLKIETSLVLLKWSWILTAVSLLEVNKNCDFVTGINSKNKPCKIKLVVPCIFQ